MVKSAPNPAPAWTNDYMPALTKDIINGQHIFTRILPHKGLRVPNCLLSLWQDSQVQEQSGSLVRARPCPRACSSRLKGLENGESDLCVSIAASMIHSHYLGFSGFATGFAFADTVINGTASLIGSF
ncbi:hypothetical protein DID88_004053 [Monilinia fructigena]|uniref:Uncharacterized protein n=1 Tax=Monilinia fructigena TaxID=38457 RepID=A0A395ISC5_9HELO|nr:hypothetical protein DID88_004053 [Monilinia fructigena]